MTGSMLPQVPECRGRTQGRQPRTPRLRAPCARIARPRWPPVRPIVVNVDSIQALKTFVEVQPWEDADGDEAVADRPKSTIEVWKSLIPPWGWGLIAGVVVLLAISVAAAVDGPGRIERAIWTYAQFGIGIGMLIGGTNRVLYVRHHGQ